MHHNLHCNCEEMKNKVITTNSRLLLVAILWRDGTLFIAKLMMMMKMKT